MNRRPQPGHPEPCRGAIRLLAFAIGLSLLVGLILAGDSFLRASGQDNHAKVWIKALTLSGPALWTAGSSLRHPETQHPGVDPRFVAGLEPAP